MLQRSSSFKKPGLTLDLDDGDHMGCDGMPSMGNPRSAQTPLPFSDGNETPTFINSKGLSLDVAALGAAPFPSAETPINGLRLDCGDASADGGELSPSRNAYVKGSTPVPSPVSVDGDGADPMPSCGTPKASDIAPEGGSKPKLSLQLDLDGHHAGDPMPSLGTPLHSVFEKLPWQDEISPSRNAYVKGQTPVPSPLSCDGDGADPLPSVGTPKSAGSFF